MGHELDQTEGITSFADSRADAWHRLGQVVNRCMTAEEVLTEAYLGNWNVRKHALYTQDDEGYPIPVPDRFATVRTNPVNQQTDYLGVVGPNYQVIQNEESTAFLDALVDESGAHFETAGALRGGRETFVTMRLPNYMQFGIPGTELTDDTDLYLAALNSHDGSGSYKVIVTPVRIVCANTQAAALGDAKSMWSVRHTTYALSALEEARQSLRVAFTFADAFSEEVQKMIDTELDPEQAEKLAYQIFDVAEAPTERARNMREGHAQATLQGLRLPTCAAIADTRYGLYNAVTEYVDHRIDWRGGNGVAPEKQIFGAYADLKSRAFDLLTVS